MMADRQEYDKTQSTHAAGLAIPVRAKSRTRPLFEHEKIVVTKPISNGQKHWIAKLIAARTYACPVRQSLAGGLPANAGKRPAE